MTVFRPRDLLDDVHQRPRVDAPTCAPSVRCFTRHDDDGEALLPNGGERTLCHYFLQAGKINYCGDCVHDLNGRQGVELPDFPTAED